MVATKRLICKAADLEEGGKGMRFQVAGVNGHLPAFVIRFDGAVHAYVNQCAHISIELDWAEGQFFDFSGLYLICSTHGATYVPETGLCIRGPCKGASLQKLNVTEEAGTVYLIEEKESHNE